MLSKILLRQHDNETLFVATTRQCHDNCHKVENDPPDHFYCIFKWQFPPKFGILSLSNPHFKNSIPRSQISPILGQIPHIFGHIVVGNVYSFEEIMWKISQKL